MNKNQITLLVIVFILIAMTKMFWRTNTGMSYEPGRIAELERVEAILTPPSQENAGEEYWLVEDSVRLYHYSRGRGKPVLVLHGGPGFPQDKPWQGMDPVAAFRSVHYYHQRGCGKSTRPIDIFEEQKFYRNMLMLMAKLGLEQQLADIERIRRILDVDQLTLIGHSFGGFLAALYAVEFPRRVEKLVLVSPADVIQMPPPGGDLYTRLSQMMPDDRTKEGCQSYLDRLFAYDQLFTKSEAGLSKLNKEFWDYYTIALRHKGLSDWVTSIPEGLDNGWMTPALFMGMGKKHDYSKALEGISCPTLVVHGEKDILMTMDAIRRYADFIPNAKVATIANAGHFSFEEQPREFGVAVAGFLSN